MSPRSTLGPSPAPRRRPARSATANPAPAFLSPAGDPCRPPLTWQPPTGLAHCLTWQTPAGLRHGDHLVLELTAEGPHVGWIRLEFFNNPEPAPTAPARQTAGCTFWPSFRTSLVVPLDRLDGQHLRLPRRAGMLSTLCSGGGILPDEVRCVRVFISTALPQQTITLHAWRVLRRPPPPTRPPTPLIDALGQWTARDWPGKTTSVAALVKQLRAEAAHAPAPTADGSGPCRVEFDGRRWWFATRDGERFFSVGPDCVSPMAGGPVLPGSAPLFRWLPPRRAPWLDAWRQDDRAEPNTVDFARANLIRAFGPGWRDAWTRLTASRLRQWGFNTLGNWSDPTFIARSGFRYVWQWPRFPSTPVTLFRDLPDVFAPGYTEDAVRCAEVLTDRVDDAQLLGYFMANEPQWAFGAHNLAAKMLASQPGTHSRRRLAAWLAERYHYNITALALAWGIPLRDFDDVIERLFPRIEETSTGAAADLHEFSRLMVRAYIGIPARAARTVAPGLLNLGMRYAYISSDLVLEGGEYFDVFSINRYDVDPPLDDVDRILAVTRRPVMIGEFHFGALDRGLPSTGLRGVASQTDRARAYRYFVEHCAQHPGIIGAHYFQWADQAVHGRFDGENYQIGLVDVCSQPYPEFCATLATTHANLAAIARGELPPTTERPAEIPRTTL